MTLLEGVLLGILQGLTEFLPISSSGHLALARHAFDVESPGVTFEVLAHFGTALAVVWVFRRRVASIVAAVLRAIFSPRAHGLRGEAAAYGSDSGGRTDDARMALHLVIATVPAALVGVFLKERVEAAFDDPVLVSLMLIVTGFVLWASRRKAGVGRRHEGLRDSIAVGLAQAAAILPGISRSGATICAGLGVGLARERAAEFALLLSVPVILGATIVSIGDIANAGSAFGPGFVIGGIAAFASAVPAIRILVRVVASGRMHRFAYYCWAVGGLGVLAFLVRG